MLQVVTAVLTPVTTTRTEHPACTVS